MSASNNHTQSRALTKLFTEAQYLIEKSESLEIDINIQYKEIDGTNNALISPIIASFWGQKMGLRALSERLCKVSVHDEGVDLLIQSAAAFNKASEAACRVAVSETVDLGDFKQGDLFVFKDAGLICVAFFISTELKTIIKKIRLAVRREGFKCH